MYKKCVNWYVQGVKPTKGYMQKKKKEKGRQVKLANPSRMVLMMRLALGVEVKKRT